MHLSHTHSKRIKQTKPTQHIEITHPDNVNLKLAFHKVASFHPHYLIFTPQTYHHPVHPVQVMAYADDITITSTHTSTSASKKYIQPYLHKVFAWTRQNNLIVNPDKTTFTLFTKGSVSYLRPKTHIQHTHPQSLSTRT